RAPPSRSNRRYWSWNATSHALLIATSVRCRLMWSFGDLSDFNRAFRRRYALLCEMLKPRNNFGNALTRLGERESGTARLEEAVAAYREALTERTRERVPLDWAMTQNNLGNALSALGERENDTARLEEAVAAYRSALARGCR